MALGQVPGHGRLGLKFFLRVLPGALKASGRGRDERGRRRSATIPPNELS